MELSTFKGYTIGIELDENGAGFDPREETKLGTMACKHNRYTLGDANDIPWDDFSSWDEVETYLRREFKPAIILPLWLYDHSGLSMRTYPHGQHARFDGGQVGFIYVTKDTIRDWYGVSRISKKLLEKLTKTLTNEVLEYSSYLNGEVYTVYIWEPGVEVDETYPEDYTDTAMERISGILGYNWAKIEAHTHITGDIQMKKGIKTNAN